MFKFLPLLSLALAAATSVCGMAVPKRDSSSDAPAGWLNGVLEDYDTYHIRYIALDCEDQHGTSFFDECCHPLLVSQSLSDRPAECTPSKAASSSAASAVSTLPPLVNVALPTISSTTTLAAPTTTKVPTPAVVPTTTVQPVVTKTAAAAAPTSSSCSADPLLSQIAGGFATYFYQKGNPGACGTVHSDSALIAAIDSDRYGTGSLCGQQILITNAANGKSVTVTVADECPTCNNCNSIDLSVGAFTSIADESTGIVDIVWNFV